MIVPTSLSPSSSSSSLPLSATPPPSSHSPSSLSPSSSIPAPLRSSSSSQPSSSSATSTSSLSTLRLIEATVRDNLAAVMALLASRDPTLDVDGTDGNGDTALHLGAHRGNLMITLLLMQRGANVNAVNRKAGYTPLHRACWNGHLELVSLLLEQGADIRAEDFDGYTPLHWASWNGKARIVEVLVRSGATLDRPDKYGYTPLHRACCDTGYSEIVFLLLNFGANPNVANENGDIPLHLAASKNQTDSVNLLVQYSASTLARNKKNQIPSELTKDEKILQILTAAEEKERFLQGDEIPVKHFKARPPVPPRNYERPRHSSFSSPKAFDSEKTKSIRKSSLPADPIYVPPRSSRGFNSRRKALASWTVEHVCSFLREIGLGVYQRAFVENELDGQSMVLLTKKDLAGLIPHPGHLQRLMDGLAKHGLQAL